MWIATFEDGTECTYSTGTALGHRIDRPAGFPGGAVVAIRRAGEPSRAQVDRALASALECSGCGCLPTLCIC